MGTFANRAAEPSGSPARTVAVLRLRSAPSRSNALTGVPGEAVGSIDLFEVCSYVAVRNSDVAKALRQLSTRPIKGRKYRARVRK